MAPARNILDDAGRLFWQHGPEILEISAENARPRRMARPLNISGPDN
jgi:hypothetical protein